MTGLLWGLLGALMIGASDCIARVTARQVSSSVLFLAIMGLSTVVLSSWNSFSGDWPQWHTWGWTASAISGFLNLLALYFLYKALARGPVAVASPAASTFTVLLVLLNIVAGQPWSVSQLLALVIVFLGIVMLARPAATDAEVTHYDANWLRTTAMYGLLAAITVTLRMFLAQEAGTAIGAMSALYLNRLFAMIGAVILVLVILVRKQSLSWPKGNLRYLVILQAVTETLALGSFLIGSMHSRVAATVGFSTFAAATAIFAWIWLGERIGAQRGFWIAVVAIGILVSIIGTPATS